MAEHVQLDDLIERLANLDPEEAERLRENTKEIIDAQGMKLWQPNPGSQTEAYFHEADEIGYGGEAGPGKTALGIGITLNRAKRSLVLRRTNKEAFNIIDEYEQFIGYKPKLDRRESFRVNERLIKVGGCEHEEHKQKYKGTPYDFIFFDQVEDFSEAQYTFIIQWNRSVDPEVKAQVFCSLNPPTKTSGLWVMNRWGAWLDPHHPRPAKSGEIRWFTTIKGEDTEVDGPGPHLVDGKEVYAKSRTFIRGYLEENYALQKTGYAATRAAAPQKYREAYHEGDFESALRDVPNQICPTAWVRAAVQRWHEKPPAGIPMCAIGSDMSGGGNDPAVLAIRHDGWFAPMIVIPADEIPEDRPGRYVAGIIMSYRRDDADVIVDMGGGYGGPTYEQLKANGIDAQAYKGAEATTLRTRDNKLRFANVRTAALWRFREALDPSDPAGSPIMIPDDPILIADLCAPTFLEDKKLLTAEPKKDVCERLGRSTNKGDAAIMAWFCGPRYVVGGVALERAQRYTRLRGQRPKVVTGRNKSRRR